jgi:hypothetical protein
MVLVMMSLVQGMEARQLRNCSPDLYQSRP